MLHDKMRIYRNTFIWPAHRQCQVNIKANIALEVYLECIYTTYSINAGLQMLN